MTTETQLFKFEFTEQELNIILMALGEIPAKNSLTMIMKIKQEAQQQIKRETWETPLEGSVEVGS